MQRHDDDSAGTGPVPQVFHQEESVEDIHLLGGLVEDEHGHVQQQLARHVEAPDLWASEAAHVCVPNLFEA